MFEFSLFLYIHFCVDLWKLTLSALPVKCCFNQVNTCAPACVGACIAIGFTSFSPVVFTWFFRQVQVAVFQVAGAVFRTCVFVCNFDASDAFAKTCYNHVWFLLTFYVGRPVTARLNMSTSHLKTKNEAAEVEKIELYLEQTRNNWLQQDYNWYRLMQVCEQDDKRTKVYLKKRNGFRSDL